MTHAPQTAPMTILVTGATGYTGKQALDTLSQISAIRVVAACRTPSALPETFKGEVRAGDLTDPNYRKNVLRDIDTVVHCAAWTAAWGHGAQSRQHFLEPSLAFIDDVSASNVTRYVNISSTAVAAPNGASNAMSHPASLPHFPHLDNVRRIEEHLRTQAQNGLSVMNLRLGFFVGADYGLGILPMLLPRLKTHLVPWVAAGRTHLPLIDGRDIGRAIALAATASDVEGYHSFNVIGVENPTVRDVIEHLGYQYGYPTPHFSVPFWAAYAFAWTMEKLDPLVPWEPLVTRSIVQFLEEQNVNNEAFQAVTGYAPQHHWKDSIKIQVEEMGERQKRPMSMVTSLPE